MMMLKGIRQLAISNIMQCCMDGPKWEISRWLDLPKLSCYWYGFNIDATWDVNSSRLTAVMVVLSTQSLRVKVVNLGVHGGI